MTRPILIAYQVLIGLSDTLTGAMLIVAPAFTLRLMLLVAPTDAYVYLSYIGAFVLPVGLSCLYGAFLMIRRKNCGSIETVWLLTALMRASVAIFVVSQILNHSLPTGWITVALTDGACVVIQAVGLRNRWLAHVIQ